MAATAAVLVRVDATARPDEATHVHLDRFDGPLSLLLALIEQRQMDILEVPLGDLCGSYLDAIAGLGDEQMPHVSAFIGVCSQLILIKSRALLPRPPSPDATEAEAGHDPEEELRSRLVLYKRFRDAGALLSQRLEAGLSLVHREASVASTAGLAGARAPTEPALDPRSLMTALEASLRLAPPAPPPQRAVLRSVTLAERAAIIRGALVRAPVFVLQDLLRHVGDRVVVAITFMAMLELVKAREVTVEQAQPWGPIVCRAVPPAT